MYKDITAKENAWKEVASKVYALPFSEYLRVSSGLISLCNFNIVNRAIIRNVTLWLDGGNGDETKQNETLG